MAGTPDGVIENDDGVIHHCGGLKFQIPEIGWLARCSLSALMDIAFQEGFPKSLPLPAFLAYDPEFSFIRRNIEIRNIHSDEVLPLTDELIGPTRA
ncbi:MULTISPECIES: hypothetical protein [Bradyrhizobium]|uniref:hypothetical protein n=1 Tax=Bradyrhizobium TaxID=374 RepID=UPI0010090D8E|nr:MULTISPECIES: hypothetical protein [Bradyrhizobium]